MPTVPGTFIERVASVVQLEYVILIFLGSFFAWSFYRIALRNVNPERHLNLKTKFSNLVKHLLFLGLFGLPYFLLSQLANPELILQKILPYLGLITLVCATLAILKLTRIVVLELLFLGHMKEGVPLLIVNMFTLVLSLVLIGWYLSAIFQIRLMPLLATSAVFSLVLGLALQDTISNLFAGLGMQFDQSFQIGDYIEVFFNNQKWTGQVQEVSWRSTTLMSLTDELVIIPNRNMSQSQIHNFSNNERPFLRSQFIKVDYHVPHDDLKLILIQAAKTVPGLLVDPPPVVLFWEMTDSYAIYKLVYSIKDFSRQYLIADEVLSKISTGLKEKNIHIAIPKLEIPRGRP